MYVDAHCHLTGSEFDELGGADGAIARARAEGVGRIICSGFDIESSLRAAELAQKHEDVYFSAGFYPSELARYQEGDWERLRALCRAEKCVALGEIGLDYHFADNPSKETQREAFLTQLRIADEEGLPVVLHSRDAAQDTLEILSAHRDLLKRGGLLHCYSYSVEMTASFLELGLYFSFGGPCTFKNANKVVESVRRIPATRILSETDCPYLTPMPYRGVFPNEPKNVSFVVEKLAEIKGEKKEALEERIFENTKSLYFKLK